MENSLRDFGELSHRTVDPGSEPQSIGVKIIQTAAREGRVNINDGRRFTDDPVTCPVTTDVLADFCDDAAKFMAENHGVIHRPALLTSGLVDIASTNADCLHCEEDVVLTDLRNR
jgi:hypothetical protein